MGASGEETRTEIARNPDLNKWVLMMYWRKIKSARRENEKGGSFLNHLLKLKI